jgi:hypothetical protein
MTTRLTRVLRGGVMLLGAAVLMLTGGSVVLAAGAHQSLPTEPLFVVESFLAARDARDLFGATGWCAALLELQDSAGQWFVDEPTTRYWLGQLTDRYLVDRLSPPVANGNVVTWTERLTPRIERSADPWNKIMTVQVSAVVRDGLIADVSAPYPPLPLRAPAGAPAVGPSGSEASGGTITIAPAGMFLGSALSLGLAAVLVAYGPTALRAAFRGRRPLSTRRP